jgi:hypothetical protein
MIVFIQLTTVGISAGPFNLFSDVDGYAVSFASAVSPATLIAGANYTIAGTPTIIKVVSAGVCTNNILLPIFTTTTTSTTTTTTTIPPTTTTTTTSTTSTTTTSSSTTTTSTTLAAFWYRLYRCDDSLTYYAGPFYGTPAYTAGMRVEGATGVFYQIVTTTFTNPGAVLAGITNTSLWGCP